MNVENMRTLGLMLLSLLVGCQAIENLEKDELLDGRVQLKRNAESRSDFNDGQEKLNASHRHIEVEVDGFSVKAENVTNGKYADAMIKYGNEFVAVAEAAEFDGSGLCITTGLKFFKCESVKISNEISTSPETDQFPYLIGEIDVSKKEIRILGNRKFRIRVDFSVFASARTFVISKNEDGKWGDVKSFQ